MSIGLSFGAPFEEQVQFLREKVRLPTERWTDLLGSAHDRAFVVAGATKAELLNDLHKTLLEPGMTLERFRREFDGIVRRHGWTGWTGEGSAGGVAWRTNVIYKTNMLTSYASGRWAQMTMPETLTACPFWQYWHSDSVIYPRPLHVSWHMLTMRAENAWWRTHFPPNGWGCMCKVFALSAAEVESRGLTVADAAPDDGFDAVKNPANGEMVQVPRGIDFGWDHAPGRTWMPAVDKYPEPLARAVIADYAGDGVFERWYNQQQALVSRFQSEFPDLRGDALVKKIRSSGEIPRESLGVAVLDVSARAMLGADAKILRMSADTTVKQIVKRQGQAVTAETYITLQALLDSVSVVVADSPTNVVMWAVIDGRIYYCALKTTARRDELYLLSLRFSSADDARKRLSPEQFAKLGVA